MSRKETLLRFASVFEAQAIAARGRGSSKDGTDDFCGTPTWDSWDHLLRTGHSDALRRAQELTSRFREQISHIIRMPMPRFMPVGAMVNVPRLLADVPDPMVQMPSQRVRGTGKPCCLVISTAFPWYVSHEAIMNRGCAILALVLAMSQFGLPAEVWSESTVMGNGRQMTSAVRVRGDTDPVDLDLLTATLTHASMLRRLMFGLWEGLPDDWRDDIGIRPHRGYGTPTTVSKQCLKQLHQDALYVPTAELQHTDQAVTWIIKHLRQYAPDFVVPAGE